MTEGYLTSSEACRKYNICDRTLRRWAFEGKIEKYYNPETHRVYYVPLKQDLLPIEEVQSILHCSRQTIYRYMWAGKLTPVAGKTRTWFLPETVAAFIAMRESRMEKIPSAKEMVEMI